MRSIACALLAIWAFYAGKTATNSRAAYESDWSLGGLLVLVSFLFAIASAIFMCCGV